jgi:hypothetical protein
MASSGRSVGARNKDLFLSLFAPEVIPKRLKPLLPGAVGSSSIACYKHGTGTFTTGAVNNDLTLIMKPGSLQAGNVAPAQSIHCNQFQAALAATRAQWSIDET